MHSVLAGYLLLPNDFGEVMFPLDPWKTPPHPSVIALMKENTGLMRLGMTRQVVTFEF